MIKYLPLIIGSIVSVTLTITGYPVIGGLFLLTGLFAPSAFPRDDREDDIDELHHDVELLKIFRDGQSAINVEQARTNRDSSEEYRKLSQLANNIKLKADLTESNVNRNSMPFGG